MRLCCVQEVTLYGSSMWKAPVRGTKVKVEGMSMEAVVHDYGMLFFGSDGESVSTVLLAPEFSFNLCFTQRRDKGLTIKLGGLHRLIALCIVLGQRILLGTQR